MKNEINTRNSILENSFQYVILLSFLCLFSVFGTCMAFAENEKLVEDFVNKTSHQVTNIVSSSYSEAQKMRELSQLFREVVDGNWIGYFVIRQYWKDIDDQKKARYLVLYNDYLTKAYVGKFRDYSGEKFVLNEVRYVATTKTYLVMTQIVNDANPNSRVNVIYRCVIAPDGNIKIRDITAENISLLASHRAEFSPIMQKEGIDGLIKALSLKVGSKKCG